MFAEKTKKYLKLKIKTIMNFGLSYLPDFAKCGENVVIVSGFEANRPDRIFLGSHIYIGPYAKFNSVGGIRIQSGVIIGPYCHIYTANHKYDGDIKTLPFDEREYLKPVEIQKYVWIGGDVIILPGVTIGEGSVIGAGSIVTKDIPPLAIAVGSPAKVIKYRNKEEYEKLSNENKAIYSIIKLKDLRVEELGNVPSNWTDEEI